MLLVTGTADSDVVLGQLLKHRHLLRLRLNVVRTLVKD